MKILLVGSGGREHALALGLKADPSTTELHCAPGNPGIADCALLHPLDVSNNAAIVALAKELAVDLVVIGPEVPLVNGASDALRSAGFAVFGPSKAASQLEGSKDFAKGVMRDAGVPTAHSFTCTNKDEIEKALDEFGAPYVVKDDGLAAGKGVVVTNDRDIALAHALSCKRVVIEEFLDGIELSVFVLTDGKSYKILPAAKDYKRIGEGDNGLNTGGMGAVSPVPFADENFIKKVEEKVVKPTIAGLIAEGIDYRGFIFIGLMNCNGEPQVIEYNCRMGDPETEVVIPRIESDFLDLLIGVGQQTLHTKEYSTTPQTATTVVMVSGGYPEEYKKGYEVSGIDLKSESHIFHSGTKFEDDKVVTNGGRVFAITSYGNTIEEAVNKSFATAEKINYTNKYFRKDIGKDLINYKK